MNLLDICNIGGHSVKKFDGEKKYIATGDIINNEIVSGEIVNYKNKPSRANVEVKFGDVLFAKMMDTIKVLKVDEINKEYIYSTGFYCMSPKKDILQDYLYLYFNSDSFNSQKNKNCSGATQKAINNDGLTKIVIKSIPSIEEQENIIKELFNINNLIKIKKEEIEKLNLLIKSQFVEMFGDPLVNDGMFEMKLIKQIGKVVSGATPKTNNDEFWNGNNIWVTPAELNDNSFIISDSERKITDLGVKSCAVNLLPKNTVILSSRAPIGKTAIAGVDMYCNQGFKNIIPSNEINSIYLYELLKNKTEYLNSLGRGATFKEISKEIVENIKIKVPPIELQDKFAQIVEQIDKQKFEFESSLKKLEELQASLMQEYFG